MTDRPRGPAAVPGHEEESGEAQRRLAEELAPQFVGFVSALRTIADEGLPGPAVPLLLLEVSRVLLAGARLGAQVDVQTTTAFQPDVGPDPDMDALRLRLAEVLGPVDTYSFVFDPYRPEVVESQLSDDLTSIANDLLNGWEHLRAGNVAEALWWWQFSYVSSWGNLAGAALNALWAVVHHDRLDSEAVDESDRLAAADEMLDGPGTGRR